MRKDEWVLIVEGGPSFDATVVTFDNYAEAVENYNGEGGRWRGVSYKVTLAKILKQKGTGK